MGNALGMVVGNISATPLDLKGRYHLQQPRLGWRHEVVKPLFGVEISSMMLQLMMVQEGLTRVYEWDLMKMHWTRTGGDLKKNALNL